MEQLLSVDELAKLVGVTPATIYCWNYTKSGPPPIKVGRFVRFRPSDVESWLNRNQRDS